MEELLHAWLQELKQVLGDNLSGVILYGSAARDEYIAANSDLNIMLIFGNIDLEQLIKIGEITRKQLRRQLVHLIFWTEAELTNAWDVFPLEFEDITASHKCLYGKDPFLHRTVEKKHIRYQIEFELRSKLLRIRESWSRFSHDQAELKSLLLKAGTSLRYLINKANQTFFPETAIPLDLFDEIKKIKKNEMSLHADKLRELYHKLHELLEMTIRKIDAT